MCSKPCSLTKGLCGQGSMLWRTFRNVQWNGRRNVLKNRLSGLKTLGENRRNRLISIWNGNMKAALAAVVLGRCHPRRQFQPQCDVACSGCSPCSEMKDTLPLVVAWIAERPPLRNNRKPLCQTIYKRTFSSPLTLISQPSGIRRQYE